MEKIFTDKAPKAIGPYSQAVKVGNMLYTSGQISINPETNELFDGDITEQSTLVMNNLSAILDAAGTNMDNIVKTTCFLANMEDFAAFNEVYAKFITNAPARSCVAVKTLPKNVLVEVEVIASC